MNTKIIYLSALCGLLFLSGCFDESSGENDKALQSTQTPTSVEDCSSERISIQKNNLSQFIDSQKIGMEDIFPGIYQYEKTEALISFNAQSVILSEEKNENKDGQFNLSTKLLCKTKDFNVLHPSELSVTGLQSFYVTTNEVQFYDRHFIFKAEKIDAGFQFLMGKQGTYRNISDLEEYLSSRLKVDGGNYQFIQMNSSQIALILSIKKSEQEYLWVKTIFIRQ